MYIVIRAGGMGTRLWPMSRRSKPKQFQSLFADRSMLQMTYDRVEHTYGSDHIFVSVHKDHLALAKKQLPTLSDKQFIVEPASKNTGPAMCLESLFLANNGLADEVVASIPSDDYIGNVSSFLSLLAISEQFVKEHPNMVVTPGVIPHKVDIGYSYMKLGESLHANGQNSLHAVLDWIEKPDYQYCKELISQGNYVCHTGMYIWNVGQSVSAFTKRHPDMVTSCNQVFEGDARAYNDLEKMSVEQAVVHGHEHVVVCVNEEMKWSDLGKWHVLHDMLDKDETQNVLRSQCVMKQSTGNTVYAPKEKLVTLMGVHDMVVIDTDDALFICPKSQSDQVKEILEELTKQEKTQYL